MDDDKWVGSYGGSCIDGIDKENQQAEIRIMNVRMGVLEQSLK